MSLLAVGKMVLPLSAYVLSPALLIDECTPAHTTNTIVKFVDDTTVSLSGGDESVYRTEVNLFILFIDGNCGKRV